MLPKTSRGLRVLPPTRPDSADEELEKLKKDEQEIQKWWRSSRWDFTKRTYSGKWISMIYQSMFLFGYLTKEYS